MRSRKPSAKRMGDSVLDYAENQIYSLYHRMVGHIDFTFSDETALSTLIRPEDIEFIKRSNELYGYTRGSYFTPSALRISAPAYANDEIILSFTKTCAFVPPAYLTGKQAGEKLDPAFFVAIKPWLDEIVPLRMMFQTTQRALDEIKRMTGNDYARIRALWPTIDVIAAQLERPVGKLPVPKGLPSPSPELREALTVATTFINSALMMPEVRVDAEPSIKIALGTNNWR